MTKIEKVLKFLYSLVSFSLKTVWCIQHSKSNLFKRNGFHLNTHTHTRTHTHTNTHTHTHTHIYITKLFEIKDILYIFSSGLIK